MRFLHFGGLKSLIRPDGGASARAIARQRTGRICPAERPRPKGSDESALRVLRLPVPALGLKRDTQAMFHTLWNGFSTIARYRITGIIKIRKAL